MKLKVQLALPNRQGGGTVGVGFERIKEVTVEQVE